MSERRAKGAGGVGEPSPRVWSTRDLMGEAREIAIRHADETYRLRVTRYGKLILTKWDDKT